MQITDTSVRQGSYVIVRLTGARSLTQSITRDFSSHPRPRIETFISMDALNVGPIGKRDGKRGFRRALRRITPVSLG